MRKQYCKNGHDTFKVGRAPSSECNECRRIRQRTPEFREKQNRWREFWYRFTSSGMITRYRQLLRKEGRM